MRRSRGLGDVYKRQQQAAAHGDIMDPPGESAYDLYRNALSIDGNDPTARAGLQGLPGQVETLMQQAVANGNVRRAEDLYNTLSDLAPGDASQGDRQGAFQSLDRARRYAPDDPRIQSTYERIATGR